jgi:hypothetical protein
MWKYQGIVHVTYELVATGFKPAFLGSMIFFEMKD